MLFEYVQTEVISHRGNVSYVVKYETLVSITVQQTSSRQVSNCRTITDISKQSTTIIFVRLQVEDPDTIWFHRNMEIIEKCNNRAWTVYSVSPVQDCLLDDYLRAVIHCRGKRTVGTC